MATIDELKATEQAKMGKGSPRSKSQSLWGAVSLIAVGAYFLMQNMGILPEANWGALFRLWPLFLILAGVNIIVSQAPRPVGSLLSGIVAVGAVGVAAVLLFGVTILPESMQDRVTPEVSTETIQYGLDGATEGEVDLDLSMYPVSIGALRDSNDLINGTVVTPGRVSFTTDHLANKASASFDTESNFWSFASTSEDSWVIGLTPLVPLELTIDVGSGSANVDLSEINLTELTVDGGSGGTNLTLPSGNYEATLDSGSGGWMVYLPREGRVELDVDHGSGDMVLVLPAGANAQFIVDSDHHFIPNDQLTLVEGDDHHEYIWQTDDFEQGGQGIVVEVDLGSGEVEVETSE